MEAARMSEESEMGEWVCQELKKIRLLEWEIIQSKKSEQQLWIGKIVGKVYQV